MKINNVTIVGAGIMGVGIAQNFAQAGLSVKLVARHQETLDNAIAQIKANVELFKEYKLIKEPPSKIMSRISTVQAKSLSQAMKTATMLLKLSLKSWRLKRKHSPR